MHYYIIGLIIAGIVIWQFYSFFSNKKKLAHFKAIFPEDSTKFQLVKDGSNNQLLGLRTDHSNQTLKVIIFSLNNYLANNNGAVSDFHLMKDIVDRNCDAKEEEIQTQIPVPLYLGLTGTMLGILIGVGFLVFGGGLNELLNSGSGSGAKGIETLLGGVALAMFSSIIGILLTTFGSYISRNAKSNLEKNKNIFLSWIQAELLPNISTNTSGALVKMTKNLTSFNNTFAQNTQDLRVTLANVNESYHKQVELMQAINRLRIGDIATANIEVYDKLKNSTDEIGVFAEYLNKANKYIADIHSLTQKLDQYEKRTQVIENAGRFFAKNEKWLAENFDIANLEVKAALERFDSNTSDSLKKLQESLNGQILNFDSIMQQQQFKLTEALKITTEIITESFTKTEQLFEKAINDQQHALNNKLQETTKLIDELKNLTHIKEGIKDFKEAIHKQNGEIEKLAKEIRELARAKTDGGIIRQEMILPNWLKYLTIAFSSLLAITCLSLIVPLFIDWISKLFN